MQQETDRYLENWKSFFRAAISFRDLAPWDWMSDSDLFGVEDPDSGLVSWCSIMGAAGEVFGISVFLGTAGYHSLLKLMSGPAWEEGEADRRNVMMEQHLLKVEFVDRKETEAVDRELLRMAGIRCRGARQWIQVRAMKPGGYLPFPVSEDEAEFLVYVLEQAAEVAGRLRKEWIPLRDAARGILVRTPRIVNGQLTWQDTYRPAPAPDKQPPPRPIDADQVSQLKRQLPLRDKAVLLSLGFGFGILIRNRTDTMPYIPRIAIWMSEAHGHVIHQQVFLPEDFEHQFDAHFLDFLRKLSFIPSAIVTDTRMGLEVLEPLARAFGIELVQDPAQEAFLSLAIAMRRFLHGG